MGMAGVRRVGPAHHRRDSMGGNKRPHRDFHRDFACACGAADISNPGCDVEPLKVLCFALIAHHHIVLGVLGFIALKFIGFGLIAVTFDLTREKLLPMPWIAWTYERIVAFHDFAHRLVAPYKEVVLQDVRALRRWASARWRQLGYGSK
jgi:hypothetical protein